MENVRLTNKFGYRFSSFSAKQLAQHVPRNHAVVVIAAAIFHLDDSLLADLLERWLVDGGVLSRLASSYRLAVYTGRPRREARFTLYRFANGTVFDPVVTSDQVENHKPAPDGLLRALEQLPGCEPAYVGDNIDDGRCARAAGIPFVGVAAANVPRREEIVRLFQQEGARAVIENINELESVL